MSRRSGGGPIPLFEPPEFDPVEHAKLQEILNAPDPVIPVPWQPKAIAGVQFELDLGVQEPETRA